MMYETTSRTPKAGTLQHTAFALLYSMREDRLFQAAMVQASASIAASSESESAGKNLQKTMEAFQVASYPYIEEQKERESVRMRKVMDNMSGTAFKVDSIARKRR